MTGVRTHLIASGTAARLGLATIALLLPTLVACGSPTSSPEDYVEDYGAAVEQEVQRTEELKAAARDVLGDGTTGALLPVYERWLEGARETKAEFERLSPPDDVADAHADLRERLEEQEAALEEVIEAAKADDEERLGSALRELARVMSEIRALHGDISAATSGDGDPDRPPFDVGDAS